MVEEKGKAMAERSYFPNDVTNHVYADRGFETDVRGDLAITFIEKWGMVTGCRGGEDSSGRAGLDVMPVEQVVERACEMAGQIFTALEARGWIRPTQWTGEEAVIRAGKLEALKDAARYEKKSHIAEYFNERMRQECLQKKRERVKA